MSAGQLPPPPAPFGPCSRCGELRVLVPPAGKYLTDPPGVWRCVDCRDGRWPGRTGAHHAAVRNGWARRRHADLDSALDDALGREPS